MQFTDVFGDSPRVKLLDFLADHIDFDYTVSEIHHFTGISRPTIYSLLEKLTEEGMLIQTRTVGDSTFYKLNLENPKVVAMLAADFERINLKLMSGEFEERPTILSRNSSPSPIRSRSSIGRAVTSPIHRYTGLSRVKAVKSKRAASKGRKQSSRHFSRRGGRPRK